MRNNNLILVSSLALITVVLSACVAMDVPIKSKEASTVNAQLGQKYLLRGDLDQAKEKLEKALEQNKRNAMAHAEFGKLQYRVKRTSSARHHFKKAIKLAPEEAEYRNSYGVFLCQIEEYDAALEQFETAANNPYYKTPEFSLDNAGVCMLNANQFDRASSFLRRALQANTKFGNAYLHMAELLYKQSRLAVADAYYQRFLTTGTTSAESLLLGLEINRDLGNMKAAENYRSRLLNDFPASVEAGEYLSQPAQTAQ